MPRDALGACHPGCGAPLDEPCMCDVTAALRLAHDLSAAGTTCGACEGDGFCVMCGGDGRLVARVLGQPAICPDCGGSGSCGVCGGTGKTPREARR